MYPLSSQRHPSRPRSARPSRPPGTTRARRPLLELLETRTLMAATLSPPAAPSFVDVTTTQVVPGNPLSTILAVRWGDASDNESGFRVDTYNTSPDVPGATPVATLVTGPDVTLATFDTVAQYAVVRAFNADGSSPFGIDALSVPVPAYTTLSGGTPIGTPGSWNNTGNTLEKALDNDLATFFDAPTAQAWLGYDLGTPHSISGFSFAPRANQPGRMVGGQLQGSDDAAVWTTLATVTGQPAVGQLTTLGSDSPRAYRYVRYLSPDGGFGNVAELDFIGAPATFSYPAAPTNLTASAAGTHLTATWTDNATNETHYVLDVYADSSYTSKLTTLTLPANSTAATVDVPSPGTYYFDLRATNAIGSSEHRNTSVTVPAAPSDLTASLVPAGGGVTLTWTDNSNIENGVLVYRRVDAGEFALHAQVDNPAATTFTDATASVPGTTYFYYVVARLGSDTSPASNTASVTVPVVNPAAPLTGTPFGSPGSWNDSGATFDKALDKNPSTFFDAPTANGNVVGLHLPQPTSVTHVRFFPRTGQAARMVGGQFQGSTDGSTWVTFATVLTTPPEGIYTTLSSNNSTPFSHVRYLSPDGSFGNVAEIEFYGPPPTATQKLVGNPIGSAGSWNNSGNTFHKALDGSLSTFFDAPLPNGNYVGYDFGGAPVTLSYVRFTPRAGQAARMVGGRFQVSNDAANWTNVGPVIDTAPPEGTFTTLAASTTTPYRFVRYLSPDGGFGNVAEVEFYGTAAGATRITGTPIGTPGSWNNLGNDLTKALDGSPNTFFDAPTSQAWVGIHAGGTGFHVSTIRFAPRANQPGRMVGGKFQGSTDGSTWHDLYTITTAPTPGTYTSVAPVGPYAGDAWQYLRYLSPDGGFGNIAELEFYGTAA